MMQTLERLYLKKIFSVGNRIPATAISKTMPKQFLKMLKNLLSHAQNVVTPFVLELKNVQIVNSR